MGIYIFSGSVLAWLPPLLFSLLNEFGASMNIGLASLNVFFVGGFALLYTIGDYDEAVVLAQNEDDEIITTSRRRGLDDVISRIIPELT
jgi:MFS-type transporter involved in bile tolerance (Atg22 family)